MNKLFTTCLVIMLALYIICAALYISNGTPKNATSNVPAAYYTLSAQVCDADTRTDVITFEDGAGNLWEVYNVDGWAIGDKAELLMHNNGTENVTDDEIIGIARGKWFMEHN